MADYSANSWNEQDSANTNATPNGIPTGSPPNSLAPTLRTLMGASTRFWRRINPFYTSTGVATAIALTFAQAPAAYTKGERIAFIANVTNAGPMTLNINGLGVRPLVAADASALIGGEITSGQFCEVWYDGTNFRVLSVGKTQSFASVLVNGKPVFTVDSDGAGSGLDADLLDAKEGAWYLDRANHTGATPALTDNSTATATTAFVQGIVGSNGRRALTVSASAPSGGADGDVWYQI